MTGTQRAAWLITLAIIGLAPLTVAAAAPDPAVLRASARAATGCFTVTATIPLGHGTTPSGITANRATNTIYVTSESLSGIVQVINGRTKAVTATIPVGIVPVATAADSRSNTIYVANHGGGTVSVISGRTNTVTATIRVGLNALQAITVNPTTNAIYAAGGWVSVISGRTDTVTTAIHLGPR